MFSLARSGVFKDAFKQTICLNKSVYSSLHSRAPKYRQLSNMARVGVRLLGEAKYLRKDKLPAGYQLIYRAPLQYYVSAANHFTTLSALAITGCAVYVAVYGPENLQAPLNLETALQTDKSDIKYYAVMFVLMCLSVRYVVMRYPRRIYRKDKECIAILEGQLPFTKRQIVFQHGEVTKTTPQGFLPWKESWYKIRDQKVLLLDDYFKTPAELHNMLTKKKS